LVHQNFDKEGQELQENQKEVWDQQPMTSHPPEHGAMVIILFQPTHNNMSNNLTQSTSGILSMVMTCHKLSLPSG